MMSLPPLSAIRVFEVAARHSSFTKAAAELCVTQSAVSHQIRALEEILGVTLFERRHRAVVLTSEGESYRRELSPILAQLDRATRRLSRRSSEREVINIRAYTTFAMRWLIPRLTRFHSLYPDVRVHLTASLQPVDFLNTEIHGAIRSGFGEWPCRADRLCETYIVPVCTPELRGGAEPLDSPQALIDATLLHSLGRPKDWSIWFGAVGMPDINLKSGHHFESSSMAYQAAHLGLGVAIGQKFLVEDDLQVGTLVMPFDVMVHLKETYYFLSSPRYVGVPMLEAFREWVLDETRETSTR